MNLQISDLQLLLSATLVGMVSIIVSIICVNVASVIGVKHALKLLYFSFFHKFLTLSNIISPS